MDTEFKVTRNGKGWKLHKKADAAIVALLTAPNIRAAAKQAGVSDCTLTRWLKRPDFGAAYRNARRQVVEHTTARLEAAGTECVDTLLTVMRDADAPGAARVSAAKSCLDLLFKAHEMGELEERLRVLEDGPPVVELQGTDAGSWEAA